MMHLSTYHVGVMQCPSCAAPIAPGARFCSSCGHAVSATPSEERRIVTVLFGDIVGYTSLAEHRDPETVKRLIDGAFALLVEDIASFGGRVDKLLGDGILALFGAPVAHEDDAERAVRAGLKMQQTMDRYAHDSALDVALRMRIGINTGEVLVGTLAGTDYTAMGDVVNTASRLQAAAPPGGVLVGDATYALTSSSIDYGESNELQPRGREQSVTTWLALDTLTAPGERARRTDLRLVGRDGELALGHAAITLAVRQGRSLLLNVVGESGVGKSRLVDELLATLADIGADDALVLEGACAPYGETNIWSPIAMALADHLGLDTDLSVEEIRTQALARITQFLHREPRGLDPERVADVLTHLLGFPSPVDSLDAAKRRDVVQRALTKVVELRSLRTPVVLSIDDLHWADLVLLEALEQLVTAVARLPFILITSMRPGTDLPWPPSNDRTTSLSLALEPLSREDSEELAFELLSERKDRDTTDQRLIGALYDRSGGNPLFLQELVMVVTPEGPASELPDSLRTLIAARLDQLAPEERQVLDNAAVLGLTGSVVGLERFAKAMQQTFDRSVLGQLDAKGLIEIEGSVWRFRSDSVREAVYQTLTKAARAVRHAGVAASYQTTGYASLDDLAHHTATAAELSAELGGVDFVPADIRTQAIGYLTSAAERARDTGSNRLTVRQATRALDLMDSSDADQMLRQMMLRLLRGAALIDLRDYGHARADIDLVLAQALADRDVAAEGEARRLLGTLHHLSGDQQSARLELGRSVDLLRTSASPALLAGALRQRGVIEMFGGSAEQAEWFFGEAEASFRGLGDERGLAYIEQHRAWLSFLSGDLQLADERLHSAADTLDQLGDRNGVGWAFGLLAFVRFYQGRFGEAEDLATVVRAEAVERGDDWAAAMMQTLIADLRLWQGRLDEAHRNAEQARNRFRRLGDKFGLTQSLSALVRAQVALGRDTAAQRSIEELAALVEGSPAGPVPLLAMAGAAMHRGDGDTAFESASRMLAGSDVNPGARAEAMVIATVAQLQRGNLDEAMATIDEVALGAAMNPFAHAAAALVHATAGDPERSLAESAAVVSAGGSTYLDRAFAAVAAAAAHVANDDRSSAETAIDEALVECIEIGDVVAIALLQRAAVEVVGLQDRFASDNAPTLGTGWQRILDSLVAVSAR